MAYQPNQYNNSNRSQNVNYNNRSDRGNYNNRSDKGNYNNRPEKGNYNNRSDKEREERRNYFTELNKSLIEWIFESVDVSKYNYKIFQNKQDLSQLLTGKHYLSGNYSGTNCFLTFTQHKGKYYSFLVERKMLSYSFEKINWDMLRITNINTMVDKAIYNGTVFNGVYFSKGDTHRFTVTDIYRFKGTDYSAVDLKLKLSEVRSYLERIGSQLLETDKKNSNSSKISLDIDVNQIYDMFEFDEVINTKLHNNTTMVRGICFYPNKSGTKLIFNYDHHPNILNNNNPQKNRRIENNDHGSDNNSHKVSQNNSQPKVQKNNIYTNSDTNKYKLTTRYYTAREKEEDGSDKVIKAILRMEPTDLPDNYDMYCVQRVGKNKLKKQKRDIAYISNLTKSKWARSLFDTDIKPKLMNCIWRDKRRKWEPISLNTKAKFPTIASKIDEDLIEIEESDDETDYE